MFDLEKGKLLQNMIRGTILNKKTFERHLFILDKETGLMRCYDSKDDMRKRRIISISGCTIGPIKKTADARHYSSFFCQPYKMGSFAIIADEDLEVLWDSFRYWSSQPEKYIATCPQRAAKGLLSILILPYTLALAITAALEKIADGCRYCPHTLFPGIGSKKKVPPPYEPYEPISGVLLGVFHLLREIIEAILALFLEPVLASKTPEPSPKRSRTSNPPGTCVRIILGFFKGIVGLITKPIAGIFDLVTFTMRGFGNLPINIFWALVYCTQRRRISEGLQQYSENLEELRKTNVVTREQLVPFGIVIEQEDDDEGEDSECISEESQLKGDSKDDMELVAMSGKDPVYMDKKLIVKSLGLYLGDDDMVQIAPDIQMRRGLLDNFARQQHLQNQVQTQQRKNQRVKDLLEDLLENMHAIQEAELEQSLTDLESHGKATNYSRDEGSTNDGFRKDTGITVDSQSGTPGRKARDGTAVKSQIKEILGLIEGRSTLEELVDDEYEGTQGNGPSGFAGSYRSVGRDESEADSFRTCPDVSDDEPLLKKGGRKKSSRMPRTFSSKGLQDVSAMSNSMQMGEASQFYSFDMGEDMKRGDSSTSAYLKLGADENPITEDPQNEQFESNDPKAHRDEVVERDGTTAGEVDHEDITAEIDTASHAAKRIEQHHKKPKKRSNFYISIDNPVPEAEQKKQLEIIKKMKLPTLTDDFRDARGDKSGGVQCSDPDKIKVLRSVVSEILREVGRKVLKGDINLTRISFPIKCMQPKTALETTIAGAMVNPFFLNKAAMSKDPIERMKYVMCSTISINILLANFGKPINPILGETFQGHFIDGSMGYAEQTSHHPPVSSFQFFGPNKNYHLSGYMNYAAHAGFTSVLVENIGKRQIQFHDGQVIKYNFCNERLHGLFWGTIRHETIGDLTFTDEKNKLEGYIKIANDKKRVSDYFEGEITKNGFPVSTLFGTLLGYLDCDGKRYWDFRDLKPFDPLPIEDVHRLPSDAGKRDDLQFLAEGDLEKAQIAKEKLENGQRHDRDLRKKHAKSQH